MRTRDELHEILCEDLGSRNCYFSPPSNIRMKYPCIIYHYEGIVTQHADDLRYLNRRRYSIIVVDECPDSCIPGRLFMDGRLKYLSQDRSPYVTDGLNHFPFTLYD